ncbi:MAG: toll/interleukin-1 receptor domain-containing protein [Actinomycetota bacterium]|nr:toll/interleukin-1 receptor domain-containing protein [Actinomycetota bacterium]
MRALDDSEWFVVLCSPEAAASEWVEREIDHWLAHKTPDRILLVLTDGDLVWDRARGDFDRPRSTALPPALFGHFDDEPRHLDLRWARGEEQLDVRHVRFRGAVAELAAPIRNMARDELEAEDVRQHRRTIRLARGATTVLVLLLVITVAATLVAVQQRGDARRAAAAAQLASAKATREAGAAYAAALRAEAKTRQAETEKQQAETEKQQADLLASALQHEPVRVLAPDLLGGDIRPGSLVTVLGVVPGCGNGVVILQAAEGLLANGSNFVAVPLDPAGQFSVRTRLSSTLRPGTYAFQVRCAARNEPLGPVAGGEIGGQSANATFVVG